jgi:hypothetical protein
MCPSHRHFDRQISHESAIDAAGRPPEASTSARMPPLLLSPVPAQVPKDTGMESWGGFLILDRLSGFGALYRAVNRRVDFADYHCSS